MAPPDHVAIAVAAREDLRRGLVAALPRGEWIRPHVVVYRTEAPGAGRCIRAENGRLLAAMLPAPARVCETAPVVAASELAEALVVGTAAAGLAVGFRNSRWVPTQTLRLGSALTWGYRCEPERARRVVACWYAILGRPHDDVTVADPERYESLTLEKFMPPTTASWLLHHLGLDVCCVEGCDAPRERPMGQWCRHHRECYAAHLRRLADDEARLAAAEAEADARRWAERSVEFAPIPGLRFLDRVPPDLLYAWQELMTMPTGTLLRLIGGRARDIAPLHTVRAHLDEAHHRPLDAGRWRLLPYDVRGEPEIPNVVHVLLAVLWQRAQAVATWKPATASQRKAAQRERVQAAVEEIFGDRCRACHGTRADDVCPVRRFDLHHAGGDGGGVDREIDTDKLRAAIIAYHDEHGVPPPEIEMLCHPCHQHQSRAQAAGCPWGDRIDVRAGRDGAHGDLYDGEDFPEGLIYTRPVPAPSRRKLMRE